MSIQVRRFICLGVRAETLAIALTLVAWSQAVEAQPEPDYPHGDFQDECSLCHGAESWSPAQIRRDFDHAARGFPLLGAHSRTACRSCHASLEFRRVETACVGCHLDVHQGELGTDCNRCHTPQNFIDRSRMARAHQATRFSLVGSHRAADCEACHPPVAQGRMQFVNTRTDCEACHLNDYFTTTEPNHLALLLPTACATCHIPVTWDAQDTNHDALFFPIYSGKHRGKWDGCADCHLNPSSYAEFSCFLCHQETKMAERHQAVSGFQYDNQACYSCHPQGTR
jgi:hypothetical protein